MSWFSRFLFPTQPCDPWTSWLLLALRLLFGVLLLMHGLDKWIHFEALEVNFPNPLHVGSRLSLLLCLFAELFCSCFVILGLFTRLMLIPIVVNMAIAFWVIHQGQPFASRELAFVYLMGFLLLIIFGPGRLSFDGWIAHRLAPEPMP